MSIARPPTKSVRSRPAPAALPRRCRLKPPRSRRLTGEEAAVALQRYRDSLAHLEELGDLLGIASCYLQMGDLHLACGEMEPAGEMYRKSLEISRHLARVLVGGGNARLG